jgi:hypothetical protein
MNSSSPSTLNRRSKPLPPPLCSLSCDTTKLSPVTHGHIRCNYQPRLTAQILGSTVKDCSVPGRPRPLLAALRRPNGDRDAEPWRLTGRLPERLRLALLSASWLTGRLPDTAAWRLMRRVPSGLLPQILKSKYPSVFTVYNSLIDDF